MRNRLIEIFGEENVSTSEVDLITCSTDATGIPGKAIAVVWPSEDSQIHKLIQLCHRKGWNLVPRGGATGLAGGCIPIESVVVDMSRMDRIIDIRPEDKEAVVESGVVVDELNNELDRYDLFFPIIPSSSQACQIGGIAATNAAGLRAHEYGRAERWIKSMDFFDGTGKLIKLRDSSDIIGSEGILGIITRLTLRLEHPARLHTLSVFKTDGIEDTFDVLRRHMHREDVSSIEFFNKMTADIGGYSEKDHIIIEFNDDSGDIKDDEEIEKVWKMRKGLNPSTAAAGYVIIEDPEIPFDNIPKFLRWLSNNKVPAFGHIAIGVFHPMFRKSQEKLIREMFQEVKRLGGKPSGEHGIGLTKREFIDNERKEKLRELKKKYDPQDIMNRGKVI